MSEETLGINYTCNSTLCTLKPNILAQDQTSFFSCTLQIHCLGYVNLDPFPFWIQAKSGPYIFLLRFIERSGFQNHRDSQCNFSLNKGEGIYLFLFLLFLKENSKEEGSSY